MSKRTTNVATGIVTSMLASLASGATASEVANPYQPLAFLAGHCWKGSFPDGKQTDEHCFTWIYEDKFLRDTHVVRGDSSERRGESIYYWNAAARQIEYLYVESDGGFSRGTVSVESNALVFPATDYIENGKTMRYRSRWVQAGRNVYEVITEFEGKDGWAPGFKFHMQRVDR